LIDGWFIHFALTAMALLHGPGPWAFVAFKPIVGPASALSCGSFPLSAIKRGEGQGEGLVIFKQSFTLPA